MIEQKKHSDKKEKQPFLEKKVEQKTMKKDPKDEKIEELTDLVKRVQAEFENFKKREENERKVFIEFSNAKLINSLLPVLDSIDSAKKNSNKGERKGIELIEKQLISVLEKNSLKEIESVGKKFNPEFHECLMKENNPKKEDGIVLEEIQKGFLFKDKVLRHSKVKINSIEKEVEEKENEKEQEKELNEKQEIGKEKLNEKEIQENSKNEIKFDA